MLKGHVFKNQIFGNQIFALFINTFLNGRNGISNNYKNGMNVTYNGSTVTVDSGAVCIQGRFLEEDTSTDISAGTDDSYCKLVIEVNLNKQNTASEFLQGTYKVVKSTSAYPTLTQTDIAKNNSGIYQYELARFRTSASGISEFQDMRTYLNLDTIYDEIEQHIADIDNGSLFVLKSNIQTVSGNVITNPSGTPEIEQIGTTELNLPVGYTSANCIVISCKYAGQNYLFGDNGWGINLFINDSTQKIQVEAYYGRSLGEKYVLPVEVTLLKIS